MFVTSELRHFLTDFYIMFYLKEQSYFDWLLVAETIILLLNIRNFNMLLFVTFQGISFYAGFFITY
jgi:hypothetical protein